MYNNYYIDKQKNKTFCTKDLSCPLDYSKLIPEKKQCIFDCIEDKSEEKIPEYEYTILTTQDSTVFSEQQLSEDGYELSNDGICTINCVKCNVNKCLITWNLLYLLLDLQQIKFFICHKRRTI